MGDGRQLRAALEFDIVLRNGGEFALPTGDESVPALGDEFLAAAIPATSLAAPSIFPVAATGTAAATAAAIATTATAAAATDNESAAGGTELDKGGDLGHRALRAERP